MNWFCCWHGQRYAPETRWQVYGLYGVRQILVARPIILPKLFVAVKHPIKMLQELESHYKDMLSHVQALIAAERGQPIKRESRNGAASDTTRPFSKLTKAEAVTVILKEKGQMHYAKIFTSMRKRGHPIKSKGALSNLLSTDGRFGKKGKGIWELAETDETQT